MSGSWTNISCRKCHYFDKGYCKYYHTNVNEKGACWHFYDSAEWYDKYIEKNNEIMSKAIDDLQKAVGVFKTFTPEQKEFIKDNYELKNKPTEEEPVSEKFSVKVFAMSGSVVEVKDVSKIIRKEEKNKTVLSCLDDKDELIAMFNWSNIVGYQVIDK